MNRRVFLRLLGAAAPVAAVAPTYFFAPVGGWKSDVIVNPFQDRLDRALAMVDDWARKVRDDGERRWIAHPANADQLSRIMGDHRLNLFLYGNSTIWTKVGV